jgi:hypothetical protein
MIAGSSKLCGSSSSERKSANLLPEKLFMFEFQGVLEGMWFEEMRRRLMSKKGSLSNYVLTDIHTKERKIKEHKKT